VISLTASDTDSLLAVHALLAGQGEPRVSTKRYVGGATDVIVAGLWPDGQDARVECRFGRAGVAAAVTAMWRDGVARATAATEVAPVVWRVTETPEGAEVAVGMRFRLHGGEWQVEMDGWHESGWNSLGEMAAAGYRLVEDRPATPGQDGDGRG
jgi:hypothetical protein